MQFSEEEVLNLTVRINPKNNTEIYDFAAPVTQKENYAAHLKGKGFWIPKRHDIQWFRPICIPDNIARGFTYESRNVPVEQFGGKDMFGVEWEYEPAVGGSMVRPGHALLEDVNDWKSVLCFPDVESWDWEGAAEANYSVLKASEQYVQVCTVTGWFERLISFMGFENALLALVDEDQEDAMHELLMAISDLYIRIIDQFHTHFLGAIDGFCFHDDWGAQKDTFFSPQIVREFFVPAMRRVTEYLHGFGYTTELHSCGRNDRQVENIIAAGWDVWEGMSINDLPAIQNKYGTQLVVAVYPEETVNLSPSQQKEAARLFMEQYGERSKPVLLHHAVPMGRTFAEEVYRLSRERFAL